MNPENTSQRDPLLHLLGGAAAGTDRYIENMEAEGQRQLVASTTLPAQGNDYPGRKTNWEMLEAMGVVRGEPVDGDALFVHATLPAGWAKRATDHSMWSEIVDDRGVTRAMVFYKAAYYDRRAHVRVIDDVGQAVAHSLYYGEGPVTRPPFWSALTEEERSGFFAALEELGRDLADDPDTRSAARLAAIIASVQEV